MTYLRRRLGDVQYFGVWEDQKRGVLHRHFLIRVGRHTTVKRVSAGVRNSGRAFGFGSVFDVQAITGDAARQASYCAKYATKSADSVDGRMTLDVRTGEMRDTRGFRPWSCSRQWGETMRSVRARQLAYVRTERSGASREPADGAAVGLDDNPELSTTPGAGSVGPNVVGSAAALL